MLFDDGSLPLAQPNHLTDEEKRRINKQNFEAGMTTLSAYLQTALAAFENNEAGKCLGNLYKAAECLYKTMLILHISYPSDTNQLKKLRQQCKNFSEALWLLFNLKDSETDRRLFTLLHDANDNPDIKIDRQDILALQHKLNSMERIVKESCEELM